MAILLTTTLTKVAYDLQETSNTFSSGLWSQAEIIGYINYAIGCFVSDTGILMSDNTDTSVVGQRLYTRPSDAGDIDRISYGGKRLVRVSLFDLGSINYKWRSTSGVPKYYHEDGISHNSYEFDKAPLSEASIRIFAELIPTELSPLYAVASGDSMPIPDCWEPAIRWETLSFALQKDGEGQDLVRADWAHKKYLYYVDLAKQIVTEMKE